jgi:hypothetical protein
MLTRIGPPAPVVGLAGIAVAGVYVAGVSAAGVFYGNAGIAAAGVGRADVAYFASVGGARVCAVAGIDPEADVACAGVGWCAGVAVVTDMKVARGVTGVAGVAASAAACFGFFGKGGEQNAHACNRQADSSQKPSSGQAAVLVNIQQVVIKGFFPFFSHFDTLPSKAVVFL